MQNPFSKVIGGKPGSVAGAVLQINNIVIGDLNPFIGGLVNYANGAKLVQGSCAYFTDEGQGVLSKSLVGHAGRFVQKVMLDLKERRKYFGRSLSYESTEEYKEWKRDAGYGHLYGKLTGTLGLSIGPIKNPNGGWMVGIRPNATVIPIRGKKETLSPAVYAVFLEYHRNKSQPLLAPIMGVWLQKHFPDWGKAFNIYWEKLYEKETFSDGGNDLDRQAEEFLKSYDEKAGTQSSSTTLTAIQQAAKLQEASRTLENLHKSLAKLKPGAIVAKRVRAKLADTLYRALKQAGFEQQEADDMKSVFMNPDMTAEQMISAANWVTNDDNRKY